MQLGAATDASVVDLHCVRSPGFGTRLADVLQALKIAPYDVVNFDFKYRSRFCCGPK